MYIDYPDNNGSTQVQYVRNKIGNNYFIVYYKNAARFKLTPKEVGRTFGVAKFTPSVNALRDWCYEMVNKYGSEEDKSNEEYLKYIEKHGFGPEVHGRDHGHDEDEHDGTKNTKMIV